MKRIARYAGYTLAGLAGFVLLGMLIIYLWSEAILRRHYEAKPQPVMAAPPVLVAQGYRLARLHGCLSCHGEGLTGNDVIGVPAVGDIVAPNLTKLAKERSDVELTVAMRQGIAPDGRGLLVMPSAVIARAPPEEMAAIIAWLRTLPVKDGYEKPFRLAMVGRLMLVLGDFRLQPIAVEQYARNTPLDLGPRHTRGRQIAAAICAECHGPDVNGGPTPMADTNPSFGRPYNLPPSLDIVGAYDLDQFKTLLRTGVPPSGKNLGMMTSVAKRDLRHFTDEEIEALHRYLVARAQVAVR